MYYILTTPELKENKFAPYVYKFDAGLTYGLADQLKITIGEEEGNYYGQVVNKLPHGMGRYVNRIGQIWEGQFKEGKFNGFMRQIFESGSHRLGQIENDEWVLEKN